MQLVEVGAFEYCPNEQRSHASAPVPLYVPALHTTQPMCDWPEYLPFSHGVQLTPPEEDTTLAPFFTIDPAPQRTQLVAASDPATATYLPVPHAMQLASVAAPSVSPYLPPTQSTHRSLELVE